MSNELVEKIEEMSDDELHTLVQTINEILEDRKEVPEVNTGDTVKFEVRDGVQLIGIVQSVTKKRCKVKLQEAEGKIGVNLNNVEVISSVPTEEAIEEEADPETTEEAPPNINAPHDWPILEQMRMTTPLARTISLDIETKNLDMREEGLSFGNPEGWEVACIGVYIRTGAYEDRMAFAANPAIINRDALPTQIAVQPLTALVRQLWRWLDDGYTLIAHNGDGFDIPILSKPVVLGGADCESVFNAYQVNYIDTCASLLKLTGRRHHLQNLIKGTLGEDESKLMPAADAPREWSRNNFHKVIDYCIADCEYTYKIYEYGKEYGYVDYMETDGKITRIEVDW